MAISIAGKYNLRMSREARKLLEREAGSMMASILKTHSGSRKNIAFIAGGETIVRLTGHGKGGRNQELALAAAPAQNSNPTVFP